MSVVCSEDLGYVGGYSGGDDVGGNVETDGAGEVVVKEAEETVGDKPVPIYVHASTTTSPAPSVSTLPPTSSPPLYPPT